LPQIRALENQIREDQKSLSPPLRWVPAEFAIQENLMWNMEKLKKKKALLATLDKKLKR